MKIRLLVALAATAGGIAVLGRRRQARNRADAALWAEATDVVQPTAR